MSHDLFGDSNAEDDALLFECSVTLEGAQAHILVGRWGVGKTASHLLYTQELSAALKAINPEFERLWYLDEHSLDLSSLLELRSASSGTEGDEIFQRALESVWRGEIARVYCRLLSELRSRYRNSDGKHWGFISSLARGAPMRTSLWKQLPALWTVLSGSLERADGVKTLQSALSSLVDERTIVNLKRCLADIERDELQPCVVVEPIETPPSKIEGQPGLAQALVTSLLNTLKGHFYPSSRTPFKFNVRVSLPWHRVRPRMLDFPQKPRDLVAQLEWNRSNLREFICKRIDWEFDRTGRRTSSRHSFKDSWECLFHESVRNNYCDPPIFEPSFSYILRHTHYRPRDVLRLVRRCVQREAICLGMTAREFLRQDGSRVQSTTIHDTLLRESREGFDELLAEAERRYPDVLAIVLAVRGLPQPFSSDELAKRIRENSTFSFNDAVKVLWDAGTIGVVATPNGKDEARRLENAVTADAKRTHTRKGLREIARWCWFEYNYNGDPVDLLDLLDQMGGQNPGLFVHPKILPQLAPRSVDVFAPLGA